MHDTAIFLFGGVVFGLAIAATLVLTIGTSQDRTELDERLLPTNDVHESISEGR